MIVMYWLDTAITVVFFLLLLALVGGFCEMLDHTWREQERFRHIREHNDEPS